MPEFNGDLFKNKENNIQYLLKKNGSATLPTLD